MHIELAGDLRRLGAISLPINATRELKDRSKRSGHIERDRLVIPVGNTHVSAYAAYNSDDDTLFLGAYF